MAESLIPQTGPHIAISQMAATSQTLGEMFLKQVGRIENRPAFYHKVGGRWTPVTWAQWAQKSKAIAGKLVELGIKPGTRISILGPTKPNWAYCDIGGQLAGLVTVGLYPMQTAEQLKYLLTHSDSEAVFVDGADELQSILAAAKGNKAIKAIIAWNRAEYDEVEGQDKRLMCLDDFLAHDPIEQSEIDSRLEAQKWDETAIFIYTSGTTGPPKGAMISHANILQLLSATAELQGLYEDDLSLSFLPMAHAAERNLAYYGRISSGICTCYASSAAAVLDELQETQPTLFGSVPRIFEKAYDRVFIELAKQPEAAQKLVHWCIENGRTKVRADFAGTKLSLKDKAKFAIADRLFFSKVREKFGGRVKQFITGAAPLANEIMEFFWAAGMPIYEAYGMTEATVCTHLNLPGDAKLGTVGRPIHPIEQKIADDGEILVKGPWVFEGYFKNPEATAETIIDGWLHTGDIGEIDSEGYLKITDRKKHLIITAGGKNLSPANIENAIKNESVLISQVHAHGDKRKFVSALIAPSPIDTLEWGEKHGLTTSDVVQTLTAELLANPAARSDALNQAMAAVVSDERFAKLIGAAVVKGNAKLANVEKVKRFLVLDRDFSQESGELTPTMKVKRKFLEEQYADKFNGIYENDEGYEP